MIHPNPKQCVTHVVSLLLLLAPIQSPRAMDVTTKMKHTPPKYFVSDKRIQLDVTVTDKAGVSLVRCYFKTRAQAAYVFVEMLETGTDQFQGMLPAPAGTTDQLDYVFLVVNQDNIVVKSQVHTIERADGKETPKWQPAESSGDISVHSEATEPPPVDGFNDSVTVDAVESSLRFGTVAGLAIGVETATAGGATAATAGSGAAAGGGAAAGTAVAGGTVATTAGLSTAAMVGIGAAAVAVGAGAAAASSGGSDDGGGSSGGGTGGGGTGGGSGDTGGDTNCSQYDGGWSGSWAGTDCDGYGESGGWTMSCAACSCSFNAGYGSGTGTISGNTLSGSGASGGCGTVVISGTFSGNQVSGSYSLSDGGGGSWQGGR
jgi:hypothetical protein